MKKKRFGVEQIISKLRQAEIMFGEGKSIDEVAKRLEVTPWAKSFQ